MLLPKNQISMVMASLVDLMKQLDGNIITQSSN